METIEQAYDALGAYVLCFVGDRPWETAACRMQIYSRMASATQWLVSNGAVDETGGFDTNPNAMWQGLDAALFLRDQMMKRDGRRIWGLTFTLHPDGKFDLQYSYDKPEGYEETGETIDVSLTDFAEKVNKGKLDT